MVTVVATITEDRSGLKMGKISRFPKRSGLKSSLLTSSHFQSVRTVTPPARELFSFGTEGRGDTLNDRPRLHPTLCNPLAEGAGATGARVEGDPLGKAATRKRHGD